MSLVKLPPRTKVISSKTASGGRSSEKKRSHRKPVWDDTVNDLSVHKSSADEMHRRKAVAKSDNLDVVKAEVMKKRIAKAQKKSRSPGYMRSKRNNALLREVLQDESQIADVLAQSDKLMSVVKDIFGDNPGKFRGLPNITTAPEGLVHPDRRLPNGSSICNPSKLDVLSDSMMDRTALNDLGDGDQSEEDEEDSGGEGTAYRPALDLARFQQLLERAELEEGTHSQAPLTHSMAERALQKTLEQITKTDGDWLRRDGESIPDSPAPTAQSDCAINDTGKVERTKARTNPHQEVAPSIPPSNGLVTVTDLQQVLCGLEQSLVEYEHETGRLPPNVTPSTEAHAQNTFSSYTTALVSSVTRLTSYFRESERRLKAECTLREVLSQNVDHLKTLVDSLTSDIIRTQEEFATLQSEFVQYRQSSEQQISTLRQTLSSQGIEVAPVLPVPRPAFQAPTFHEHYPNIQAPSLQHQPHIQAPSLPGLPGPRPAFQAPETDLHPGMVQQPEAIVGELRAEPMDGLPRPHIPGEGGIQPVRIHSHTIPNVSHTTPNTSRTAPNARLLSPPKQTDSPSVEGKRSRSVVGVSDCGPPNDNHLPSGAHIPNGAFLPMGHSVNGGQSFPGKFPMSDTISVLELQRNLQQVILQQQQAQQPQARQPQAQQPPYLQQQEHTVHQNASQPHALIGPQDPQRTVSVNHQIPSRPVEHDAQDSGHPTTTVIPSQEVAPPADSDMRYLQQQLAELNKQHLQAQSKLQSIYRVQTAPPGHTDPPPGHSGPSTGQGLLGSPHMVDACRRLTVSPPISPISIPSERSVQATRRHDKQPGNHGNRMIKVSLPRADVSGGNAISPVTKNTRKSLGKPLSSALQAVSSNNSNMAANRAWFALSSHVGAS